MNCKIKSTSSILRTHILHTRNASLPYYRKEAPVVAIRTTINVCTVVEVYGPDKYTYPWLV